MTRSASIAYIPALDGLRAIAVALVLLCHADFPFFDEGGVAGVDVFFVISGYLITTILLKQVDRTGTVDYRRFYVNRLIRLWPALIVAVVVMLIPGLIWLDPASEYAAASVAALAYLTPLTAGLFDWKLGWNHTWTLGLEEYFYLAFPATLVWLFRLRLGRRTVMWLLAAVGTLLLSMTVAARAVSEDPNGIFDYFRVGGIAWGCALAMYLKDRPAPRSGTTLTLAGILLIATGLWLAGPGPLDGLCYVFAALGACLLIAAFISDEPGPGAALLGTGALVYLGVISYEIYLWHGILLGVGAAATGATGLMTSLWVYPVTVVVAAATHALLAPLQGRLRARNGGGQASPARASAASVVDS